MPDVEIRWTTIECGVGAGHQNVSRRVLAYVIQRSSPRVKESRFESVRKTSIELHLQSTVIGSANIRCQSQKREREVLIKHRLSVKQSSTGSPYVGSGD